MHDYPLPKISQKMATPDYIWESGNEQKVIFTQGEEDYFTKGCGKVPHAKYFHISIKYCMHGWLHLKYMLLVNSLFIHLDCIDTHNEQEGL